MSADTVSALEARADAGSATCEERGRLASHYTSVEMETLSEQPQPQREAHLMWLVEHCPELEHTCWLELGSTPGLVAAWKLQADKNPTSERVLENATLAFPDESYALSLYQRAEALEPNNPLWSWHQAAILDRAAFRDIDDSIPQRAYAKYRRAAELSAEPSHMLVALAQSALAAGATADASSYATEALRHAKEGPRTWNTGNLVHGGHMTLGQIALRSGDRATAKQHLLASARTPGSPQLNSFGPDLDLAAELLAAGERDVVVEYLELCRRFWKLHEGDIDTWQAEIRDGKTPRRLRVR